MKSSILFLIVLSIQILSGNAFDEGMKQYKAGNYKEAAKSYKKACTENRYGACVNLGFLYTNGQGVAKDYKQAVKYLKKACSEKNNVYGGCTNLSVVYEQFLNDNEKAKKYAQMSCEKNDSEGCYELGYIFYKLNDKKKSTQYYKKSCELGNGNACNNVAALRMERNDKKQAYDFLEEGCKLNDAESCLNFGNMQEGNSEKAMHFFKKSCTLGSKEGCRISSRGYEVLKGYQLSTGDILHVYDASNKQCKITELVFGKPIASVLKEFKNYTYHKYTLGLRLQPSNATFFSSKAKCIEYRKALEYWSK